MAVDDEHLALELIEGYVRKTPGLRLTGRYQSAPLALEAIQSAAPDLLLLDIQMPGLSGLNLLQSLRRPPVTIFTTAYPDYALDAFDLDVVDYLLKPFGYDRFLRAIGKAREIQPSESPPLPASPGEEYLSVKVDGKLLRIPIGVITYVEGWREYVKIHTLTDRYIVLDRLHRLEEMLPAERFIRIHKSYLVAIDRVTSLEGNQLMVNGKPLPVSRSRKEEVVRSIFG